MQQNSEKIFLVLKKIVLELVARISLSFDKNTCDWSITC